MVKDKVSDGTAVAGVVLLLAVAAIAAFLAGAGAIMWLLGQFTPHHPGFGEVVVYLLVAQIAVAVTSGPSYVSDRRD